MMKNIIFIIGLLSDLFLTFFMLAFIPIVVMGLWWLPIMWTDGNKIPSLIRASIALIVCFNTYFRWVFKERHRRAPFNFYFYSATLALGIIGYLYGIFRVFL